MNAFSSSQKHSEHIVIYAPHFTASVILGQHAQVYRAAPIIKYMRGWTQKRIINYCDSKGWEYSLSQNW